MGFIVFLISPEIGGRTKNGLDEKDAAKARSQVDEGSDKSHVLRQVENVEKWSGKL
jgi:hypothetical protein